MKYYNFILILFVIFTVFSLNENSFNCKQTNNIQNVLKNRYTYRLVRKNTTLTLKYKIFKSNFYNSMLSRVGKKRSIS
jgi:hypothetical protein